MIPSRESGVNEVVFRIYTTDGHKDSVFTRLCGEVKDSGFQEARTVPTTSVSLLTTVSAIHSSTLMPAINRTKKAAPHCGVQQNKIEFN